MICCPIPFIHTGLSILASFAFSSDNSRTADEPSQGQEQSSNLIGSAILLDCMTSFNVVTPFSVLIKRALGFFCALERFLTVIVAICSSVVPYFRICAFANRAAQNTGNVNDPRDTSQLRTLPGLLDFSAPTTNTESQMPEEIYA